MTAESKTAETALKLHNELFDTFDNYAKLLGPFHPDCALEQERLVCFTDSLRYLTEPNLKIPHYKEHIKHLQNKIAKAQAPAISQAQPQIKGPE